MPLLTVCSVKEVSKQMYGEREQSLQRKDVRENRHCFFFCHHAKREMEMRQERGGRGEEKKK